LHWQDEKFDEALLYLRAATEINQESAWYQIHLADSLASSGRCREAAKALHEAELRNERYEQAPFTLQWLAYTREEVNRCWDEVQPTED
jgi:predicted Zn-dependent protease